MPHSFREFAYWMTVYRHNWRASAVFGLLNPLLFLVGIGVGLGHLVDTGGHPPVGGFTYVAFLAPGLLAASAMQTAFGESSFSVYNALRGSRTYRVAAGSPLEPADILYGQLLFVVFRLATTSAAFVAVMALLGAAPSPLAVLDVPGAVLTGLAFAAPATALAVTVRRSATLGLFFRFVILPLYMFSGTFFAVTQLPAPVRDLAYLTPLWQGVDLCRTLSLGTATTMSSLVHVAYLTVCTVAGVLVARSAYRRELHD